MKVISALGDKDNVIGIEEGAQAGGVQLTLIKLLKVVNEDAKE